MSSSSVRFMITIPNDLAKRAEALKKEIYYDKPYAEMYRQLIQLGINSLEQPKNSSDSCALRREG